MHEIPPINIWIHGTKPQHLFPKPLSKLHIERLHKFMHCEPGLHLAQTLDPSFHHYHIARSLHEQNPQEFPWDTFYLFGWSGILHPSERFKSAQKLHKALKRLVQEYEGMYHKKPIIRIITHSHGGNVALHLPTVEDAIPHDFTIHELILLACPVQKLTAHSLKNPLFAKAYSLHSHWDFVQIADPQGWSVVKEGLQKFFSTGAFEHLRSTIGRIEQEPFFSERHFNPLSKLMQVRTKISGRNIMHIEFMLTPFVTKLPSILSTLRSLTTDFHLEQDISLDIVDDKLIISH